jgi:hypothetical protein
MLRSSARDLDRPESTQYDLGLSLMFQGDGVLPLIVMDGLKEQTMGQYCVKVRESNCQIKQTEPYSPWKNAAESAI